MEEFFKLILSTIILRPYVFAFLLAYLFIAYTFLGWRRVLVFTLVAWVIAFLSEYSSITNGFPYGDYQYTYLTQLKPGEIWALGEKELYLFGIIPFIDSLSYTFLTFIGYALSIYLNSPIFKLKNGFTIADTYSIQHSLKTAFVGAILVTFIDIIVDPIATMGKKWFLGEIHYYVHPGDYFGVPITNYLGWFLTSFVIIFVFQRVDKSLLPTPFYQKNRVPHFPLKVIFLMLLYLGVIAFNIVVTFSIQENRLGIASTLIQIPIFLFILLPLFQDHQQATNPEIKNHLEDFPNENLNIKF